MNKDALGSTATNLLTLLQILGKSGPSLLTQAGLHTELARLEWAQEKQRLSQMILFTLLGFTCLLCLMLVVTAILLAVTWNTIYQLPTAVILVTLYGIGVLIAWRSYVALANRSKQAFKATREELAADFALLRSQL